MRIIVLALALLAVAFWQSSQAVDTITFSGKPIHVNDARVTLGQVVPQIDLVGPALQAVDVGGKSGRVQVIASILSLNTKVCSAETKRLEDMARDNPNVDFIVVTKDLPFALQHFSKENKIKNLTLASDFRGDAFGDIYGTRITDSKLKGLNNRAVFVIDANGKLIYKQIVKEINTPPNYRKLAKAIHKAEERSKA